MQSSSIDVSCTIQWHEDMLETECSMCKPFRRCFCAEVLFFIGFFVHFLALVLMDP